jgi:hypothetical protein
METNGGEKVQIHIFLISALLGGEWSASRTDGLMQVKKPQELIE